MATGTLSGSCLGWRNDARINRAADGWQADHRLYVEVGMSSLSRTGPENRGLALDASVPYMFTEFGFLFAKEILFGKKKKRYRVHVLLPPRYSP